MAHLSVFVLLIFISTSLTQAQLTTEQLTVNSTRLGQIVGIEGVTKVSGRLYRQFLGIPYAKSPAVDSRFLPAEPMAEPLVPVGQTFSANKSMSCCPQFAPDVLCWGREDEDCLGLNIYAPLVNGTQQLPVIFFIHGGGFIVGSGAMYGGARLLESDVILVTPNYRLGVLGFFSLDYTGAAGNAGMYDLAGALLWVKTYIADFGGNPDSITIAGQSAGAVAVTHLMLSPVTRGQGLFHRAIAMSGTALNEWGTTSAVEAKEANLQVAQKVNCYDPNGAGYDAAAVAACMRTVHWLDLRNALYTYQLEERSQGRLGYAPVTPVIQNFSPGPIKFLDQAPVDTLEAGLQDNVPLIMGTTRHDGSFVFSVVFNQFLRLYGLQNDAAFLRTRFFPMVLESLGIQDPSGAIYDTLAEIYLGTEAANSGNFTQMIPGLTDLHSVFFYKAAAYKTLRLHSRIQNNSYWYSFDFKGSKSLYSTLTNTVGNPIPGGITHGDDLLYIFDLLGTPLEQPEELAVSKRLGDYWSNFATSGNPMGGWPTFSEDAPRFLVFSNGADQVVNSAPNELWRDLSLELWPEIVEVTTTTMPPEELTSTQEEDFSSSTEYSGALNSMVAQNNLVLLTISTAALILQKF